MSSGTLYCPKCGQAITAGIPSCPSCGVPFVQQTTMGTPSYQPPPGGQPVYQQAPPHLADANSKKITAGLCALLIGGLGVHKFVLGYNSAGWVYVGVLIGGLLVTCLSLGLVPIVALTGPVMGIISLIEGIMYLTKSDEEFYHTHIANRKEWF